MGVIKGAKEVFEIQKRVKQLEKIIVNEKIIIGFFANWCTACVEAINNYIENKKMIQEFLREYKIRLAYVDTDKNKYILLRRKFNVKSVPTLIGFEKGKKLFYFNGKKFSEEFIKDSKNDYFK